MKVKYRFKRDVSKSLTIYSKSLKSSGFSDNTIRQYRNYAGIFLTWLNNQAINQEDVVYNDIISFIHFMKQNDYVSNFINRVLLSIRHYYDLGGFEINPANNIYLRGVRIKIPEGLIPINDLTNLYKNYKVSNDRTKRNRVMLGLMVFQGVTTSELGMLELNHINYREAKVYVPGGEKTNSRVLDLWAIQLFYIYEYITNTRPRILSEVKMTQSGRELSKINTELIDNKLFFSTNGSLSLKSTLHHLFREIKKMYPQVNSVRKIRHNVISNWLRHFGIRKVQYMAGHKYVGSTRRYMNFDLTELSNDVKLFHPMG